MNEWTRSRPTVPGWYWALDYDGEPKVCELYHTGWWQTGDDCPYRPDDRTMFAGPIVPPALPTEPGAAPPQ